MFSPGIKTAINNRKNGVLFILESSIKHRHIVDCRNHSDSTIKRLERRYLRDTVSCPFSFRVYFVDFHTFLTLFTGIVVHLWESLP